MNEQNTQRLYRDFPRLFRKRDGAMAWGIACGDGWVGLICELSRGIEDKSREFGLLPESDISPVVVQVKEKFGTLSFYLDFPSGDNDDKTFISAIRQLVIRAADQSSKTCERCDHPSMLRRGGWWHAYCDSCEEDYQSGKRRGQD